MSSTIRLFWAVGLALACYACSGERAVAHPHIWINLTGELLYASDGAVTGLSETWQFDDIYSAFAIQGLHPSGGHEFSRDDLAPLLGDAVAALKENGAFTHLRTNGAAALLGEPTDVWFAFHDGVLALHFTLLLKSPVRARTLAIEIYDPTWFVDFEITMPEPLTLVGAPPGCKLMIAQPNNRDEATALQRSEAFFLSLSAASNFGAQFARKIAVTCP